MKIIDCEFHYYLPELMDYLLQEQECGDDDQRHHV